MKFSMTSTGERNFVPVVDSLELLQARSELMSAWEDLDQDVKNLAEAQAVMENIQTAINLLNQCGQSAVPVLNVDKSLESLIGIPEKLITADKAVETLGDKAKAAWETIKKWFQWFVDKVKALGKKIHDFFIREKIVEKKIIVTVEKEVPVEIVKEVKVYVEKIIEKKVEVEVEPTVTLEDLQKVPSYTEYFKQLEHLQYLVNKFDTALQMADNELNKHELEILLGKVSLVEIFSKYLGDTEIFEISYGEYEGIDIGKLYKTYSTSMPSGSEKFPVKNITEWSKDNYLKAWRVANNVLTENLIVRVNLIADKLNTTARDHENLLAKAGGGDEFLSERMKHQADRLGKDISDEGGRNSTAMSNLNKLRTLSFHLLRDAHSLILRRQDFTDVLHKVAMIYMKIDKFAKQVGDDAFHGKI